jgi:6-phosphogluconolactonase (cycloisomerase 2 family)
LGVAAGGRLTWIDETWMRAGYPRSFAIDPTGRFVPSCHQRGDSITAFRSAPRTGALRFTGKFTAIGSPAKITFLT